MTKHEAPPEIRVVRAARRTATALALIAAISLMPMHPPEILLIPGATVAVLVAATGVVWRRFARRVAAFAIVACIWSSTILVSDGLSGLHRAATVAVRSSLAFATAAWLLETTAPPFLLAALMRLQMPRSLIALLATMLRQFDTLRDEARRMLRAKAARTYRRVGPSDWPATASLLGMLFVRSHDRAERMHRAMLARGWAGDLDTLLPIDGGSPRDLALRRI